jgi:hypothetical protein
VSIPSLAALFGHRNEVSMRLKRGCSGHHHNLPSAWQPGRGHWSGGGHASWIYSRPEKVSETIRERYPVGYSLRGAVNQTLREKESRKPFASLISVVLTDMAVLGHLVVLECGGPFIFRSFSNALHVRILAPRPGHFCSGTMRMATSSRHLHPTSIFPTAISTWNLRL